MTLWNQRKVYGSKLKYPMWLIVIYVYLRYSQANAGDQQHVAVVMVRGPDMLGLAELTSFVF